MKIELLVATMHQTDCKKFFSMNLQTSAVLANQADRFDVVEEYVGQSHIKLVTTPFRGASRNRNTAIEFIDTETDVILFADDDMIMIEDYEKIISEEFQSHPEAEAIHFTLEEISKVRDITLNKTAEFKKATRLNTGSWGVCGLAIKCSKLRSSNVKFNECFGPGTYNDHGEDTIFVQQLLKAGVKTYMSPKVIANIDQSESSWFDGYNKKYFEVGGSVLANIYPCICYMIAVRSSYKFSRNSRCNLSFSNILNCYMSGIARYKRELKADHERAFRVYYS